MHHYTGHSYKWVPSRSIQPLQRQRKYKFVRNADQRSTLSQYLGNQCVGSLCTRGTKSLTKPLGLTNEIREAAVPKRSRFKYVSKGLTERSSKPASVVATKVNLSKTRLRTAYKYVRRGFSNRCSQSSQLHKPLGKQHILCSVSTRFKYSRFSARRQIRASPFGKPYRSCCERDENIVSYRVVSRYALRRVKPIAYNQQAPSAHHYRRIVQKAVTCLRYRRRPVCRTFVKTGRCDAGDDCRFVHDKSYLRICPRFLSQRCTLGSAACPLAHVLDPCRIPICEFHEGKGCTRIHCPYLHVSYPANAPLCPDFLQGRCRRGRLCDKRHAWRVKTATWRKPVNATSKSTAKSRRFPQDTAVGTMSFREAVKRLVATLPPPSTPPLVPQGSLRHVHPAPAFIPLLCDENFDHDELTMPPQEPVVSSHAQQSD